VEKEALQQEEEEEKEEEEVLPPHLRCQYEYIAHDSSGD